MEKKNEEVNINSLLEYIKIVRGHCKHKEFKSTHAFNFIEVKLLECKLNIIDKKLKEVSADSSHD